ncbi:MAG: hypothetical protein P8X97_04245 [Candidatus Bathyarchaeota archaeon]
MLKKVVYFTFIIAFLASGILTLTPDATASKVCGLGYYAHCSFTPYSTIILFVAAMITYLIARKTTGRKSV